MNITHTDRAAANNQSTENVSATIFKNQLIVGKKSQAPSSHMWSFTGLLHLLWQSTWYIWVFWIVGWTKQDIWGCHLGLLMDIFKPSD